MVTINGTVPGLIEPVYPLLSARVTNGTQPISLRPT